MSGTSSQSGSSHTWELSLYELHRKPHEMVSDTTKIAISPRALHSELMCPICLDLMRNAQTTKECLHRFCQECIITALRSGNKECPTCRKKLVSKRSLRPDPNFDALIAKIYPNREELNAQQEKQQQSRRSLPIPRRKRKAVETPPTESESPEAKRVKTEEATPPPEQAPSDVDSEEVELQIWPHPNDPSMEGEAIRTLVTSKLCTVAHLVKYLTVSSQLDSDTPKKSAVRALNFDDSDTGPDEKKHSLYIQMGSSDEYVGLPSGSSLKQITDTYWTGDKLKLYAAVDDSLPSSSSS